MTLNPAVRSTIVISIKAALGAILGNTILINTMHDTFNTGTHAGLINLLKATVAIVGAAESKVWLPKLMAWVNSPTPEVVDKPPDVHVPPSQ